MVKKNKTSKKLGRDEEASPEELLKRGKKIKQFLEVHWGRIGLELQQARKPDDVLKALRRVPQVEWCEPFRDEQARCLLEDGSTKVHWRELRLTREAYDNAFENESLVYSEYNDAYQKAEEATTALKAATSQFQARITLFCEVALIAKQLGVKELVRNANRLEASLKLARNEKQVLKDKLSRQEGWYARNEIVKFAKATRYEHSPINFAKAMSGMPQYAWISCLRKCPLPEDKSLLDTALNYQLFELLRTIIKRVKPLRLRKVELLLKKALQKREDPEDLLKIHFGQDWGYIKQAFLFCEGKRFKRREMPFRIMAKIQAELERSKTFTERVLAKREALV